MSLYIHRCSMFDLLHHEIFHPLKVQMNESSNSKSTNTSGRGNVHTISYNKYFQSEYGLQCSI